MCVSMRKCKRVFLRDCKRMKLGLTRPRDAPHVFRRLFLAVFKRSYIFDQV